VVTDGKAAPSSGVRHAGELVALAEAMVGEDDAALAGARQVLRAAMGPEALVDAVAVASNFERMVRIADATGIPLDWPVHVLGESLREELGLERFAAAALTPRPGPLARALGRALRPLVPRLMRVMAAAGRRFARV